jgi:hypothetical protein
VSKFHPIWCLIAQESSFGKRGSSFSQALLITGLIRYQYRTPVPFYRTLVPFIFVHAFLKLV